MPQFKCKMCGGSIIVNEGDTKCDCDYCGTTQTVPNIVDDAKMVSLHNRANTLRLKNEFDKASIIYENIITENPKDAEAHWCLLLCRYGIEYVDDKKTATKIPTCHRTSIKSIFEDQDYIDALENADVVAKRLYESEAKVIDKLQKKILAISQKEDPFDIFICYKETDELGNRTKDSVIAQEIYDELVKDEYKVFFSRITLESKLGMEYEPYIFAALNSAKVMLLIGTKPEYFNAVWVKNEWSRFLSLFNDSKDKKYLIPCYKDMDAYELPEELTSLQSQDMGKLGFIQDLIRGVNKLFNKKKEGKKEATNTSVVNKTDSIIKRCHILIEDGNFDKANELAEEALNIDPENAYLYEILLLCDYKLTYDKLELKPFNLEGDKNYEKILRFGDDSLKQKYIHIIDSFVKTRYDFIIKTLNSEEKPDYFALKKCEHYLRDDLEYLIEDYNDLSKKVNEKMLIIAPWYNGPKLEYSLLHLTDFALYLKGDCLTARVHLYNADELTDYTISFDKIKEVNVYRHRYGDASLDRDNFDCYIEFKLNYSYFEYENKVEHNYYTKEWTTEVVQKKRDDIARIIEYYNLTYQLYEELKKRFADIGVKCNFSWSDEVPKITPTRPVKTRKQGCYIATCVYGSYDCSPVWRLRRYRDNYLAKHWWGKAFIKIYYAISPKMVKLFGKRKLFRKAMKRILDRKVKKLEKKGYIDTPYYDVSDYGKDLK